MMIIVCVLLFLLNLGDIHSTYLGVQKRGMPEKNPVAVWAFRTLGFWPSVALKLAVTLMTITAFLRTERASTLSWSLLLGLTSVYGWVVVDNYCKLVRGA